jgi:signal transduction histidine kinase
MQREPVDLGEIAARVLARHTPVAASRGIELVARASGTVRVLGNATALDQVLDNLIKNAIAYTPKGRGSAVTVSIEPDYRGKVALTVTDTGIGIKQEDLFHIFEPFYRGDTSRARGIGTGSSGLGLAIVNEIVRLHHGAIRIRSVVGTGTSIRILLPEAAGAGAPAHADGQDAVHEIALDFSK